MYERFYGFTERPFDLTANPRFLVATATHREALSTLQYAMASSKGITLLLGEAGTGKTTTLQAAVSGLPHDVLCVQVQNPALTRQEFIEFLAGRFVLSEAAHRSKAAFLIELEVLLRQRALEGRRTLLVVDEAQSLSDELLEEIRLLANLETPDEKLLLVLLAGQPELADRLNDASLRQLKQRIGLRCGLRPFGADETAAYIAGRIRAAGGTGAQVFTREAVMLIHERSRGIPRLISVICDNALLGGFAAHQRPVTRQTVEDVCHDFDLPDPQAANTGEITSTPGAAIPAEGDVARTERVLAPPVHMAEPGPAEEPLAPEGGLFASYGTKRRFAFLRRS
jgi:general secretion pathway protein A